uniref:Uncharacterized protein n=1 Tax=Rhizophora mucronata TaxID=61149 RepID=A0A2P2N5D6_RHIMU
MSSGRITPLHIF